MAIVDTVSALDALNERIKLLEEELGAAKLKHRTAAGKAAARKVLWNVLYGIGLLGVVVGGIVSVFGLVGSFYMGEFDKAYFLILFAGAALLLGNTMLVAKAKNALSFTPESLTNLRNRIRVLEADVAQAKERKRKLLVSRGASIEQEIDALDNSPGFTAEPKPSSEEKECPMCAEMVKAKAKICRFCRHEFVD